MLFSFKHTPLRVLENRVAPRREVPAFQSKVLAIFLLALSLVAQSPRDELFNRTLNLHNLVKGGQIQAHWMEDGNSFWFIQDGVGGVELWKYDPVAAKKTPLIDLARLRKTLMPIARHELSSDRVPFDNFAFLPGEESARFDFEGHEFILQLKTYIISPESDVGKDHHTARLLSKATIVGPPPVYETLSPDGLWLLGAKDGNLYARSTADGRTEALTRDGTKDFGWDYGWDSVPVWAPDSRAVVARKADQRNIKTSLYPIMHWLKPTPEVEWIPIGRTGIESEHYIIDVTSRSQVRIDSAARFVRGWRRDGSELLMTQTGKQKLDLLAADRKTGSARLVFTETTKTFLDVNLTLPNSPNFTPLADNRFLWLSEREGWNQIYLFNFDGTLSRKLTIDQSPVERIVTVDERNGWVYYTAHGGAGRPYDLHLYRVKLDGAKPVRLTEATGQHDLPVYQAYLGATGAGIQFSPSRQFFLDTHSDVNRPPQTDLRKADGTLVQVIERADAAKIVALSPNPPEEFTAKAADGQTDLYGVLYKPYDFDPNRTYPVVDFIYGGPQMTRVPRTFATDGRERAFADLGLIMLVVDARGTPGRGKAFQDVVYNNIGRNEIPDHVAVLKQLAATRPYMDINRAGVIGGSFGGYFAIRAMLQAPEVFRVGVAMAPGYDLPDLWMGPPEKNKEAYEFGSNAPLAANLIGHLLLIHGTSDVNAPLAGTMRMIDALERAGKLFDLVILPEKDHSAQNSTYSLQAAKRYFVEYLKP